MAQTESEHNVLCQNYDPQVFKKYLTDMSIPISEEMLKKIALGVNGILNSPPNSDNIGFSVGEKNIEEGVFPLCTPTSFVEQEVKSSEEQPQVGTYGQDEGKDIFFKKLRELVFKKGENPIPIKTIYLSGGDLQNNGNSEKGISSNLEDPKQNFIEYFQLPNCPPIVDGKGEVWNPSLTRTKCIISNNRIVENFGLAACRRQNSA